MAISSSAYSVDILYTVKSLILIKCHLLVFDVLISAR